MKGMTRVMRKLVWLAMMALPFASLADVPPYPWRYTIHRLHRVGYEILPEKGIPDSTFLDSVSASITSSEWCAVAITLAFGIVLLIGIKSNFKHGFKCVIWRNVLPAVGVVGLGCALMHSKWIVSMVMGYRPYRPNGLYFRNKGGEHYVDERKYYYVHAEEPGWKYEDEVGLMEMDQLMAQVEAVKKDIQAVVNENASRIPMSEPHWRVNAVKKILMENDDLRKRCRGIPIEYIASEIDFNDVYRKYHR